MRYREVIAAYYEICTELRNTLCGQHIEFFNVKRGGT